MDYARGASGLHGAAVEQPLLAGAEVEMKSFGTHHSRLFKEWIKAFEADPNTKLEPYRLH